MYIIKTKDRDAYLIRDGFLKNELSTNIQNATLFSTKKGAENFIKSCISKKSRKDFQVIDTKDLKQKNIGRYSFDQIQKLSLKNVDPETLILENPSLKPIFNKMNRYIHKLNELSDAITIIKNLKTEVDENLDFLQKAQGKIDEALTDLDHFAEGSRCSASEGYKFWNMQHILEEKRRDIKDFVDLYLALSSFLNNYNSANFETRIQNITNETERTYEPRVLKELFIGGEI